MLKKQHLLSAAWWVVGHWPTFFNETAGAKALLQLLLKKAESIFTGEYRQFTMKGKYLLVANLQWKGATVGCSLFKMVLFLGDHMLQLVRMITSMKNGTRWLTFLSSEPVRCLLDSAQHLVTATNNSMTFSIHDERQSDSLVAVLEDSESPGQETKSKVKGLKEEGRHTSSCSSLLAHGITVWR